MSKSALSRQPREAHEFAGVQGLGQGLAVAQAAPCQHVARVELQRLLLMDFSSFSHDFSSFRWAFVAGNGPKEQIFE